MLHFYAPRRRQAYVNLCHNNTLSIVEDVTGEVIASGSDSRFSSIAANFTCSRILLRNRSLNRIPGFSTNR